MSQIKLRDQAVDPPNPGAGERILFAKSTGFFQVGDSGPAAPLGSAAVVAHVAEPDPHPQYTTNTEATTIAQVEAGAAVAAHVAALDPHPQYTTNAEAAAAAPVQSVNTQTGAVVLGAGDVGADPAGTAAAAVAAHVALPNPHAVYQLTSQKGNPNGYASLDGTGKVPVSQLPAQSALTFKGVWNANTNSPALTSGVGTQGDFWIVSVAGTTNLDGVTDWQPGDWAVFNGTAWVKSDNSDSVTSVNGQTGVVVLGAADVGADPVGTGAAAASAAVSSHEAALDPHPQYTTAPEAAAAAPVQSVNTQTGAVVLTAASVGADPAGTAASQVAAHVGAANPHSQYQLVSQKGVANGYASLDSTTRVPPGQMPVRDLQSTAGATSTASAAYNTIAGLSLTGLPAGTYLVRVSLSVQHSSNSGTVNIGVAVNAALNTNSERSFRSPAFVGANLPVFACTAAKVTISAGQAINAVWNNGGGGTASTALGRSIEYERIG